MNCSQTTTAGRAPFRSFRKQQVKRWFEPSVRQVISLVSASQGIYVGQPNPYDQSEPLKLVLEPMLGGDGALFGEKGARSASLDR